MSEGGRQERKTQGEREEAALAGGIWTGWILFPFTQEERTGGPGFGAGKKEGQRF